MYPNLQWIAQEMRARVGGPALRSCLDHDGPGRLLLLAFGKSRLLELARFQEQLLRAHHDDLYGKPQVKHELTRAPPQVWRAPSEAYTRVDVQLDVRLEPERSSLWTWLWSWIWPRAWGDTWSRPPTLTGGMPPCEASIGLLSPVVACEPEAPELVFFEGIEAPSWSGSWLVTVDGRPPLRVGLVDAPTGLILQLWIHPWLAQRADVRQALVTELALLAAMSGLRLQISGGLQRDLEQIRRSDLLNAVRALIVHLPELEWVSSGALVPPAHRALARGLASLFPPARPARCSRDMYFVMRSRPEIADDNRVLERLQRAIQADISGRPRPRSEVLDFELSDICAPGLVEEALLGKVDCVAFAQRLDGTWLKEASKAYPATAQLRIWAEDPEIRLGAVCPGYPNQLEHVVSNGLFSLVPCAVSLLLGSEHLPALVSLRALHHGPFHQESLSHDRVLVQFAHLDAPQLAARWQILSQLVSRDSLFAPRAAELPADLAEYDADTRTVLVRPAHVPDLYRKLAAVVGWARARASSPTQPVERVLAAISDPTLARLWLPVLWLREIAVWTVEDGRWTRVDEAYTPSWEPPPWVPWEPAAKG